MLIRAATVSAMLAQAAFSGATVHADDVIPPVPKMVSANVHCQSVTPDCAAALEVKGSGSREAPSAHRAAKPTMPPSPPPPCHYDLVTDDASVSKLTNGDLSNGRLLHQVCAPGHQVVGTPLLYAPQPASPATSTRPLVDQAVKTLHVPLPQVLLSPAADATQFVGLPVWMSTRASWIPKSVTVSAGGVSLTMTATPAFSVWSMGDGGSVTCRGPGTPYPSAASGKPPRSSPDCGWTYARASVSEPGGVFPVSVTTHWKVSWSTTTGLSGSEPDLTVSTLLGLRVSEIQALVTDVRP
jgi:hypothetical protein